MSPIDTSPGMKVVGAADDDLIRRATGGDREAFTALVRRHDRRMRGLAYKLLGDSGRMDDALQNAYLQAFVALPRFRRDANFASWLYRIVYNACIDEARRAMRRPEPVDTSALSYDRRDPTPGPETMASDQDATIRALAALPLDQRVTVVLVDGEGIDHATAARILRVAPGTVASRLSRARTTLRRVLGEES